MHARQLDGCLRRAAAALADDRDGRVRGRQLAACDGLGESVQRDIDCALSMPMPCRHIELAESDASQKLVCKSVAASGADQNPETRQSLHGSASASMSLQR